MSEFQLSEELGFVYVKYEGGIRVCVHLGFGNGKSSVVTTFCFWPLFHCRRGGNRDFIIITFFNTIFIS